MFITFEGIAAGAGIVAVGQTRNASKVVWARGRMPPPENQSVLIGTGPYTGVPLLLKMAKSVLTTSA